LNSRESFVVCFDALPFLASVIADSGC